jgi:hypothetical protein
MPPIHLSPEQTPEQRKRAAKAMGRRRWAGVPSAQRSELMRQLAARSDRRTKGKERCPCGRMTLKRAQDRAGRDGKGLDHLPGCTFYRAAVAPLKRPA